MAERKQNISKAESYDGELFFSLFHFLHIFLEIENIKMVNVIVNRQSDFFSFYRIRRL